MYICSNCGQTLKKWYGQCPKCKEWNTIDVQTNVSASENKSVASQIFSLADIKVESADRYKSGSEQLDLVLGGGFVHGSITLFGGRPGIGKSTLILKVADYIAKNNRVLYVSGEENLGQIKLRAQRLEVDSDIMFANEQNAHNIMTTALEHKADFLIIDSIQTTTSPNVNGAASSISQLKSVAFEMMEFAKRNGITTVLIGHVTKDGDIAGPKLLEHMVDTVLYIETEINDRVRVLRSEKNRFGTTDEIGLLEMTNSGLETYIQSDVGRDEHVFHEGTANGALKMGNRQMLVESQALVSVSSYPSPKRSSQGIDVSRLNIMLAILQKYLNVSVNYDDVYVKIRGGVKANCNQLDLALIASLLSAKSGVLIDSSWVFIGEVTLTGEVLTTKFDQKMAENIAKLGFSTIVGNDIRHIKGHGITVYEIKHVSELKELLRR